jgi:tetratricopeptide (TPR) repeat protein
VLVVAAAPVDLRPALNLGVELARLEDMVRRSAIPIRMRRVFPPTFAQLEKELSAPELERRRREPRVLHFLGHGEMDGLWFEKEDGSGERISTNRIVRLLKGSPVRLALLNACWSATELVASLCHRLTKEGGIPTAIGHGKPVADVSAIEFAREFYWQLVLGKSVGAAKNLAANTLVGPDKPGATEVKLKGEGTLLLAGDLAAGERPPRVEDGMPLKGALPGATYFAGRAAEFTDVATTLGDTEQVAYGLWGIGGIGKTALALELARRNAWRYPGGIAWVDARDVAPPTPAGMLQHALAELEPASTAPDAASGLVRLMKEAPILVVLDNLETLHPDEYPVLARFLTRVPRNSSRVLVTARSELKDFDDVPGTRSRILTTGLDDYSGAHHAYHYARLKDVKALRDEYPRVAEGGRVEGKCALVSRRLSGHPRMIELAVGMARHSWEKLEESLQTLSGDLEEQLGRLLETGLRLVGPEGQALLSFLPLFFRSGKFIKEEMEAVVGAAGREGTASGEETEPEAEKTADDASKQTVERGLEQLEHAGLMEFVQGRGLYTFHQTLLDHVGRQPVPSPDRDFSGRMALLAFHARYVGDRTSDDPAIDRCIENVLSMMETAWGLREGESPLDGTICFIVDRLGSYFERRGLWRIGERWLERAIHLRRSSTLARDQAALSAELHQLAQLLHRRGEHAEARRLLRDAIAMLEGLGDRRGYSALLHLLAIIEHAQGDPAEARRLLRDAITVAEELGDRKARASSLHQLAIIEHTQGDPAEARRLLRDTIAVAEELGDRRRYAASLHELAVIEQDQANPAEARRLLREAIAVMEGLGDRWGRAASLHQLAIIEHAQGNPVEARRLLREVIPVLEELGDLRGRAASLHVLAIIEHAQGDPAEARRLLREAIALKEELGDRQALAASLHQLAAIEHAQGDPAEARRLLRESIAVTEELGDRRRRAASLHMLAVIEHAQGNLAEARRLFREAIAVQEELGDRRGYAASLHQLAAIEQAQGNLVEVRRLLEGSIEAKREIGDLDGIATSLGVLAQLNVMDGRFEEALAQGREAVRLLEGIGSSKAAAALKVLGTIESIVVGGGLAGPDVLMAPMIPPPDQALANIDQALGRARADGQAGMEVMLLFVKARKLWEAGSIEACDQALEEVGCALERVEGEERRELEGLLAQVKEERARTGQGPSESVQIHIEGIKKAEAGDSAGALECFQKSADLSRSEGDDHGVAVSLLHAGHVLLVLGRVRDAREKIVEGLDLATKLGDEELLEAMWTVATIAATAERS